MRESIQSILVIAILLFTTALADRPAYAQAEAKVSCKDGSSYTVSVPGGSCKAVPGEYATCVGGTEGTESKAVCGGGCTAGGDGKCEAKQASTQPVGPKIRPEAGPKPAGIKTTSGGGDAQKNKIGVVAQPPAGVKGTTEESAKLASKTTLSDITIKKPIDKSSPILMTYDPRSACSKNPACRVVRDDAELTAYCVGDKCVAARKAGKGQMEYFTTTMSDAMVGRIRGTPIKTEQGIIAILIGNVAPPTATPAARQGIDLQKSKASVVSPPAGGLLDDRSAPTAGQTSGAARGAKAVKDVTPTNVSPTMQVK